VVHDQNRGDTSLGLPHGIKLFVVKKWHPVLGPRPRNESEAGCLNWQWKPKRATKG
jgi:hypothetical protein